MNDKQTIVYLASIVNNSWEDRRPDGSTHCWYCKQKVSDGHIYHRLTCDYMAASEILKSIIQAREEAA